MTSRPTITNIHTEEDANGIRVRIEGEGDLLQGHLTVMVRPAEVEGSPDVNGDSEGSETSDWGQPDALPVDMGFGHFMLNLQTGVIQWCPSGIMQPDASPDWVVINDPSISEDPTQGNADEEHRHYHHGHAGQVNSASARPSSPPGWDSLNAAGLVSGVDMNDATASGGIDSGRELTSEVCLDQTEARDMANSQ